MVKWFSKLSADIPEMQDGDADAASENFPT
jgi:hypothetical protein